MRGEKPGPDMFDEAMKKDMFEEAADRAKDAPVPPETDEKSAPAELPKDADMFDVAMQEAQYTELDPDTDEDVQEQDMFDVAMAEAMEPEIELKDEDLEEIDEGWATAFVISDGAFARSGHESAKLCEIASAPRLDSCTDTLSFREEVVGATLERLR